MAERRLEIIPVTGIGEVVPGADLAGLVAGAAPWLRDGDVLVVTSKIVSKAEGRLVDLPADGPERDAVRREVLAAETARVVARRGDTWIVQTHHGFVMAAAGIDASNVDPSRLVLLPKDPDASARALRAALADRFGVDVAVIVSDTTGRTWRNGLTDIALGAAGIDALRDHRGEMDAYGNELRLTQMAVVDELAGAAELVKGKRDGVPVAVIRGYLATTGTSRLAPARSAPDGIGVVAAIVRDPASDLFRLGTAEARAAALHEAARPHRTVRFSGDPVDPRVLRDALEPLHHGLAAGTTLHPLPDHELDDVVRRHGLPAGTRAAIRVGLAGVTPDAGRLIRLGVDVQRLCIALSAAGLAAVWAPPVARRAGSTDAGQPGAATGAGVIAVGMPAAG